MTILVHTFDIIRRIRRRTAEQILNTLTAPAEVKAFFNADKQRFELKLEDYPGLDKIILYPVKDSEEFYILTLVVNPQTLIHHHRMIQLFDCSPLAILLFQEAFPPAVTMLLGKKFSILERWSVHRIDYAIDVKTPYADRLATLARRVRYPWRYSEKHKGEGSAYFGCKSVLLNFYSKQNQVEKEYSQGPDFNRLVAEAKNVFRIEIQCGSNKIKALKRDHGLPNILVLTMLNSSVAATVVCKYYLSTLGPEEFVSMAEARNRIRASGWQGAKQDRVLDLLQLLSQARKLPEAKEQYVKGTVIKNSSTGKVVKGSESCFRQYLKDSTSLGFNPVILPRDWSLKKLPNPIDQLLAESKMV